MATFNVVTNRVSHYIPESGELLPSENGIRVSYGGKSCTLKLLEANRQAIRLRFSAESLEETDRVYVNIPFVVKKGDTLVINNSETKLEEKFTAEELPAGKALFFKTAKIELSEVSVFNYPIFYYSPYMKKQGRNYNEAAGILTAELDYMTTSLDMKVTFEQ
jgi:hypothetical protein